MVFFDLNVPYNEGVVVVGGSEKPLPDSNTRKNARLKIVVKAMELGYSGIAYNRSIKGVMSDSHRCTISFFPISSLLKVAPTLSSSVKFHRDLLNVPLNSPFRQYTRLTVSVDNLVHATALNPGNPVLKTYDLIAVRPLNQTVFDQACKISEVDIIAIDFSEKLPFRLKLPMVKAAIERGVYFEITYSHLISDVQARRQMVTNAKLLVDWTRGKNLIFSSAATSVNEVRGPYDVANLSYLLGLSMERAKAAISKNCRSLMASALRKKQFYKEAIRVERISFAEKMDSNEPWFGDWHVGWDKISSGEGDLVLDDIAKFFSASNKLPKTSKAIDFASIAEESNSMRLKDWLRPIDDTSSFLSVTKELIGSSYKNKVLKQSNEVEVFPLGDRTSLASTPLNHQTFVSQGLLGAVSQNDIPTIVAHAKELETPISSYEESRSSNRLLKPHVTPSKDCMSTCVWNLVPDDNVSLLTPVKDIKTSSACIANGSSELNVYLLPKNDVSTTEGDPVFPMDTVELSTPSKELDSSPRIEYSKRINGFGVVFGSHDVGMNEVSTKTEGREQTNLVLTGCDVSICRDFPRIEQQHSNDAVSLADDSLLEVSYVEMQEDVAYVEMQEDVALVSNNVPPNEALIEPDEKKKQEGLIETSSSRLDECKSGKTRHKQMTSLRAFPFPFKPLLKSVLTKKKSRKSNRKINMV